MTHTQVENKFEYLKMFYNVCIMDVSGWQIAGGGEVGGGRGAEAEDRTAAERKTESPGGEQCHASASFLQVAQTSPLKKVM